MALNPLAFTENVVKSFLRYQFTTYAFATVPHALRDATINRILLPAIMMNLWSRSGRDRAPT